MQRYLGIGIACAITAAGMGQAQDSVEGPFYKFSTVVPDAIVTRDGEAANLVVEYFADNDGNISNVEISPADTGVGLTASTVTGCEDICFPDPSSPTGIRCISCFGPSADIVLVSLDTTENDAGGLDFSIGVQRPMEEGVLTQSIRGFEMTDDGQLVPVLEGE